MPFCQLYLEDSLGVSAQLLHLLLTPPRHFATFQFC